MAIEIGALGPLSVRWREGDPVPLVPQTRPALLLALLAAGDGFARTEDEVAAFLWPRGDDDSERDPVENIGKPLHTLRAAFKASAPPGAPAAADIVLRGDGYLRLAPEHVRVDAFAIETEALALLAEAPRLARHERAATLLERFGREFLPELRRERAAGVVRERLNALRRRLVDETFDGLRAAGSDRAVAVIEDAFAATPGDAAIAYRYVTLLTLERQSERAWRVYERHAAAREALGLGPAPEVGALLASLREPVVTFVSDSPAPLVGRAREREAIERALEACAAGGRIAIVASEGRGRSRLLHEAVAVARASGALVGAARALVGLAGDRVVRDLHRSLLAAQEPGARAPRMRVRLSGDALPGDIDAPLNELRLTVADLTRGGRRVVLALDDPHHLGRASLERIEYLLEASDGVTFVTTARTGLDRLPARAVRIEIGDLPLEDERRAIESMLGTSLEGPTEARLRALWPGNLAFLLAAAARIDDGAFAEALDDGTLRLVDDVPDAALVPDAIAASIELRLHAFLKAAKIAAAALAASRTSRGIRELAHVSGIALDDLEMQLAGLVASGLITREGERYAMAPAVASIAARSVSPPRFAEFERRLAQLDADARVHGAADASRNDSATSRSRTV